MAASIKKGVSIPEPTPENVDKVVESIANMMDFVDEYHQWFPDLINIAREYLNIPGENNWKEQTRVKLILCTAFSLAGKVVPGADVPGTIFGFVFDYISTYDPDGNLAQTFAHIWERYHWTLLDARGLLATYLDSPEDNWDKEFTNPITNQSYCLGDLAINSFPSKDKEGDAVNFNTLLEESMKIGNYELWKSALPQRWHNVCVYAQMGSPESANLSSKEVCCYLGTDTVGPDGKSNPDTVYKHYLGRVTRGSADWASKCLCDELFKIAVRSDVLYHWSLPRDRGHSIPRD